MTRVSFLGSAIVEWEAIPDSHKPMAKALLAELKKAIQQGTQPVDAEGEVLVKSDVDQGREVWVVLSVFDDEVIVAAVGWK